ncbi:tripartite tricarboxylate transporter TctB family protein [Thalassospira povalilytica]|uniref:tripartite tricarboxylate transporter TctB family protein n=1 Tax=Thalassospira povalilytica TaxID=732237 RepID=UPI003AA7E9BF
MPGRLSNLSLSHLAFLLLVAATAVFLNWSAISASTKLYNLIVVVPVGIAVTLLVIGIIVKNLLGTEKAPQQDPAEQLAKQRTTLVDLVLLGFFAMLCFGLTTVGFDIATFLFVWVGIVIGGERRWWLPPLYAALFTLFLVEGFGSLFPFPMPLLVL